MSNTHTHTHTHTHSHTHIQSITLEEEEEEEKEGPTIIKEGSRRSYELCLKNKKSQTQF